MAELSERYNVNGFLFETEKEAEIAKRELEGIKYIQTKTDMENPEMVFQVYNNLIEQKLFETPIGYCFLNEIREYLLMIPAIENEDIKEIPVIHIKEKNLEKPEKEKPKKVKNINYKLRCMIFMTTTLILAISVITMMFLTSTSDNVNILNYENKIIDKYSTWEQELEARESALDAQE